ncbi:hypothetical protein HHK36_005886 [Tetracentron sinense]|uniref:Pectinesterase inhibitor domain-containing protein n=1 Tax=Tetracentron sinense TaxID=13715 RepID=A0A834ZW73_TETSI|nr:hypothetical protein HHK36_005886 [Tetracentron sinense]
MLPSIGYGFAMLMDAVAVAVNSNKLNNNCPAFAFAFAFQHVSVLKPHHPVGIIWRLPLVITSNRSMLIAQMGSLDEGSVHEFDDESLVSPVAISRKVHSPDASQHGSFSSGLPVRGIKCTRNSVFRSLKIVVFTSKINLLMPFGPLAILVHNLTGHHGWVFFLSLLGITPLAERLGYATEQLAFFTGATVGGLLNATFGNATELIISVYALKNGMIRVVQQSLLGSILSNMLLVLGCAFFSGGIIFYKKEQVFNKAAAVLNSGLLLMAVMGLLFPAVLHFTHTELHFGKSELALSRFSSCIMLVAYAAYLGFQLTSDKNLYIPVNEGESQTEGSLDDEEMPEISKWESIIWLSILTAWISILSEYLVDALQGASVAWNMPIAFISVIVLPIVGNAAEHASAIMFAMKDKLDISLGVAIGSSTQISMFGVDIYARGFLILCSVLNLEQNSKLIPFCVVVGWIMGRPMDLNFQLFETATLFITVLVVAFLLQEGTSNYFKGLMLILCYLIVAASFFVHVDPASIGEFLIKISNPPPCRRSNCKLMIGCVFVGISPRKLVNEESWICDVDLRKFVAHLSLLVNPNDASELVTRVCKQTESYVFCVATFDTDPRAPKADLKGLAYISFNISLSVATNTSALISQLLANAPDPGLKQGLDHCLLNYGGAVYAIQQSLADLDSSNYTALGEMAGIAKENARDCERAFIHDSPFTIRNQRLRLLSNICDVITGLLIHSPA